MKTIRQFAEQVANKRGIGVATVHAPRAMLRRFGYASYLEVERDDCSPELLNAFRANIVQARWVVSHEDGSPKAFEYAAFDSEKEAIREAEQAAVDYLRRNGYSLDDLAAEAA